MLPVPVLTPSRTIVTSFNPRKSPVEQNPNNTDINDASENDDNGEWVLCLAASKNTIACALSSGEVQVYDPERLHVVQQFSRGAPATLSSSRPPTLTDLVYAPWGDPVLVSTDASGALAVMDMRTGQRSIRTTLPTPALSLALGYEGGYLAAVGSRRGRIHFTDLRQPGSLLGTYIDSHTDDVTQVVFADHNPTHLLSGAEDGLVCYFDTTQPTEETARKSVCSIGTAVRHVGFCGHRSHIYCLTGSETVSLWHADSSTVLCDYGWETRARLTQAAAGANSSNGSVATTTAIDYVVDATWNEQTQQLMLLAGTSSGDSVLYSLGSGQFTSATEFRAECVLRGGHRGVVRAWTPLGGIVKNNNHYGSSSVMSTFMTAGEDARLCEWRPMASDGTSAFISTPPTHVPRPGVKRAPSIADDDDDVSMSNHEGPFRRQRPKTTTDTTPF